MSGKNDNLKNVYNSVSALIFATIFLFIFMYVVALNSKGGVLSSDHLTEPGVSNVLLYVIGCLIFCIIYFASYHIFNKYDIGDYLFSRKYSKLFCLGTCLGWMVVSFFLEDRINTINSKYNYYRMPLPFILYTGILLCIFLFVRYVIASKYNLKIVAIFSFIIMMVINGFCLFESNFFVDKGGGVYHIQAYVSSIINVLNGYAYSAEVNSIYGHYGIFYYLPVKFISTFVNRGIALGIVFTIYGLITFAFFYIVLKALVKNHMILILAFVSLCILSYESIGNYYQLFPHRILFQPIIVWCCISMLKCRNNFLIRVISGIVVVFSIIWNLEVGIVCAIAFVLTKYYLESERKNKYFDKHILENILLFIGLILFSYALVNIYNIFAGGHFISLGTFIYPIMSKEYDVVGLLQVKLDIPFSNYFSAMLLFLFSIFIFWDDIKNKSLSDRKIILIISSVLGLGLMPYYINRAVMGNLKIIYFPLILILAMIADTFCLHVGNSLKNLCSDYRSVIENITLMIISILFFASLVAMTNNLEKTNNGTHDYSALYQLNDMMDIPDNTAFIGFNSDLLCLYMNRINPIAVFDWPDIIPEALEYVWEQIERQNIQYIFVDTLNEGLVLERYEQASNVNSYMLDDLGSYSLIKLF